MRIQRRPFVASLLFLLAPSGLLAQTFNLRDLLTNFLIEGILLAPPAQGLSHSAHFIDAGSPQIQALSAFSGEIAGQLSSFPLASSAGGFTYRFDPELGVLTRTTDSFGPIYTERADTIGQGRFNFGVNYSSFTFDRMDGLSLRDGDLKLVFTHAPTCTPPCIFEGDVITTDLRLRITTNITAFVLTYGVMDQLDLGVAVPLVKVDMFAQSQAVIQRLATSDVAPHTHEFQGGGSSAVITQSGSASGLGDVVARAKFRLFRQPMGALAMFADVRVPTGDDRDLLGIGVTQVKGALIGSAHFSPVSVHVNGGYTWSAQKKGVKVVPDRIDYNLGIDVAAHPRFTFTAELLGQVVRKTSTVLVQNNTYVAQHPNVDATVITTVTAVFPRLVVNPVSNQNRLSGAVGFKVNPVGNLLLTFNGLFPLDKKGLQDRFTPLVGVDYSF